MPVRLSERKLPFSHNASDLGQHVQSADGKVLLISFLSSPIVVGRLQSYVVFVTDGSLAGQVETFQWQIENGSSNTSESTTNGYFEHSALEVGELSLTVELKGAGNSTLSTINLRQEVIDANADLEALFNREDTNAPVAGHPPTSRELINDLRRYIDEVAPRDEDSNATSNSLLFAVIYNEVLRQSNAGRAEILEQIANSLSEDDKSELLDQAETGIGIAQIRPQILCMYFQDNGSTILGKVVLPGDEVQRSESNRTLLEEFGDLSTDTLIDLFNVLRFPKSNIGMCKFLLDALKDEFNTGQTYQDIFNDRDDGLELIEQFKKGPFTTS